MSLIALSLLRRLGELGIEFRDLRTRESSLEEIFVDLVHNGTPGGTDTPQPAAGDSQ